MAANTTAATTNIIIDVSDGAKALKEDSYMDDILTGGKTVEDIDKIEKDVGFILASPISFQTRRTVKAC